MIDVKVYLDDSHGNVLCFKHAVKAVMTQDENITINVDIEEATNDYGNSCFGLNYRECSECRHEYENEEEEEDDN